MITTNQIHTLEELNAYLSEMSARADEIKRQGWPIASNVESICAHMWKQFLPHAITFWTTAGVLEQIAACIAPPQTNEEDNDDDESHYLYIEDNDDDQ
jgi:hypothetical protein